MCLTEFVFVPLFINSANRSRDYPAEEQKRLLADVRTQRTHFSTLVDADKYEKAKQRGERRLSHKAMTAALIITLYKEEPILQLPYMLIETLLDVDEQLTAWRYRHALMVHRFVLSLHTRSAAPALCRSHRRSHRGRTACLV